MKLAILIASRNRPDLVGALVERLAQSAIEHDVYVVECGSEPNRLSRHTTLWYPDSPVDDSSSNGGFRGKCFGHYLALQQARAAGPYDYYWVLMNDLVFEPGVDVAAVLIEQMEREERLAILSPTCKDGLYPGSGRSARSGWRAATTVDYLGFMMRGSAVEDVGFLNPDFRYCWGAIHELAYKCYRAGWFVAYSDAVAYEHLGGSTYGAAGTNTISREEYQREARRFAYDYFAEEYGADWEKTFFAATEGHAIEIDTFAEHKRLWSEGFSAEELAFRARRATERARAFAPNTGPGLARLHLGCGTDYRDGWINVDSDPSLKTDLCAEVHALVGVEDASVDCIEAAHLFEHLPLYQARAALREWSRVLKPGGELLLELPDLEACIRLLGRHTDDRGIDLAMTGIYGWPPDVEAHGTPMLHKWGWTRATLADALSEAGFEDVAFGPITQTWRPAAKIGRDMRVRACLPLAAANALAPVVRAAQPSTRGARGPDAFPLGTDARVRILAWPDYADARELDLLFERFGTVLAEHRDACLCLRHDRDVDGSDVEIADALCAAFERTLQGTAELNLLLVDDPIEGDAWRRLGAAVDGVLLLPSSSASPRAEAFARTRAATIANAERLRALLATTGSPSTDAAAVESSTDDRTDPTTNTPAPCDPDGNYSEDILNSVDWRLVEQIGELNPWTYPAQLGNLRVNPGKGTEHTPEYLEERTRRLGRLVLHTAEVEFEDRSLLELGCDCAYWSARAVELGATSVVGVDKSERKLRQAELYFSRNDFVAPEQRTFLQGDLAETATWDRIARLGPFDVTLCVGMLEHAEDPATLLRDAAAATTETLVVVTRLAQADRLIETLIPLGFEATVEDDLEAGLTAWVARRTRVSAPPQLRSTSNAA